MTTFDEMMAKLSKKADDDSVSMHDFLVSMGQQLIALDPGEAAEFYAHFIMDASMVIWGQATNCSAVVRSLFPQCEDMGEMAMNIAKTIIFEISENSRLHAKNN